MADLNREHCHIWDLFTDILIALSFIVTRLVWKWILNPEFGIQKIVRNLGHGYQHRS
jgi:ABC-type sugar transport system permease subunit